MRGFFSNAILRVQSLLPGILVAVTVASAASFVSERYGGPKFLFALLLGVSLNFLSEHSKCMDGIEFSAKRLMRIGVALLGARIAFTDVAALGIHGVVALVSAVLLTIGYGLLMTKLLGLRTQFGLLSGGATGICGISAALAISSTLPQTTENEHDTLMTAIGVATLSTMAMVLYPLWVEWTHMSVQQAGLFLGGSIHDVAQVVGAGNIISPEVAKSAALAKMFRVVMLAPIVLTLAIVFRLEVAAFAQAGGKLAKRPPILPFFLVAFIALVVINSLGWIPVSGQALAETASQWALVISIAALGVKTSFRKIVALGWKPIVLMISETAFIAIFMAVMSTSL